MRQATLLRLILSFTLSGCVQASLAPPDVRKVSEVIDIDPSSTATDLFGRAQAWLARNHGETKVMVSHVDPTHFRILAKADMYCNASLGSGLRSMGMGLNVSRLTFNIDFQAKAGKVRILYDELYYYLQDMRYEATKLVQGPSNRGDVDTLYKECILPLHRDFVANLAPSKAKLTDDF